MSVGATCTHRGGDPDSLSDFFRRCALAQRGLYVGSKVSMSEMAL
jgi:hypothetical protein